LNVSSTLFSERSTEIVTLATDWKSYDEDVFGKPRVDKFGDRLCFLRGAMTTNLANDGELICCAVLPENCRPSVQLNFAMIVVSPTGEVFCHVQANDFVSLCGVSFVASISTTQQSLKTGRNNFQFRV